MAQSNFEERIDTYEIESTNVMTGDRDRIRYLYYQLKMSMAKAKQIDIIVSFLMESGVRMLLNDMKRALDRGVRIRILTGNYLGITQAGTHGSAWKYCCSLIGAAPTPYYKAGEALMNHDYDKVLKNRIHDKSVPVRDTYQQLKTAQKKKDEVVQYKLGDAVTHPKFGHGIVEKINQRSGGVHLHIRFDGEVKCIDQKWLSRKKYT